jgi:hypothetical protein
LDAYNDDERMGLKEEWEARNLELGMAIVTEKLESGRS